MDRAAFTSTALGRVRRTLEGYDAFYPAPIPRSIDYSSRTVNKLADAVAAVHRLAGASRLLPSPDILMAPYIRLEAVLSSKIEGTQTTLGELLLFEAEEDEETAVGDVREVLNYIRALNNAMNRLPTFPLSRRLIRETHATLMKGVRGETMTPGEFRRSQNWIGPRGSTLQTARFVPPPVDAMNESLDDFENFLHERDLPDLIVLALAHYQFETIHPFLDGNGRVGRLLVPLVLADRGILQKPMLYLSVYFEQRREEYVDLLFTTSTGGDLEPWLNFFLDGVTLQSKDAEDRTVRLVDFQQQTRDELMQAGATMTTMRLAEGLLAQPYITARNVERRLGVTFPTAQKAISSLVERGVLEETTGQSRNRVYHSPRVFEVAYGLSNGNPESS